mgnify:CR=1 FL=1
MVLLRDVFWNKSSMTTCAMQHLNHQSAACVNSNTHMHSQAHSCLAEMHYCQLHLQTAAEYTTQTTLHAK